MTEMDHTVSLMGDVRVTTSHLKSKLSRMESQKRISATEYGEYIKSVLDIEHSVQRASENLAYHMVRAIDMKEKYEKFRTLSGVPRNRSVVVSLLNTTLSLLRLALPYVTKGGDTHLSARIDTLLWVADGVDTGRDTDVELMLTILKERHRQVDKWGSQDNHGDETSLRVTLEEFGEVAKAMNEHDDDAVTREIVDTAACLLAWLEHRKGRAVAGNQ